MLSQINAAWGGHRAGPLASLLVVLRAVYQFHQDHHWRSGGKNYYGDHLLFERLYAKLPEEIDSVAERCVGMGGSELIHSQIQGELTASVLKAFAGIEASAVRRIGAQDARAFASLQAENELLGVIDEVLASTRSNGTQNLLQGIADAHEGNVYLLQQRLTE